MKVNQTRSAAAAAHACMVSPFGKQAFTLLLAFSLLTTSAQATVRYVKTTGSDDNTGLSWAQAYASVQKAINVSVSGDEIWVAAGTYKPTLDPFGNATPADPRDRTFYLKNGVKLYGGFAGTETMLSERDWVVHLTTLSGDFNGNDVGFTNNGENAYHVVLSVLDGANTEINGFTIKGGNGANAGSLTVEGNPQVNRNQGGGLGSFRSSPTVLHCVFSGNRSVFGGGVSSFSSGGLFGECTFSGNMLFNSAAGGGMYNNDSSPVIRNCSFSGNFANDGGGMRNIFSSSPTITNCTFSANSGGGLANYNGSTPTLKNCIIWGNGSEIIGNSTPTVTYSIVQGGYAGTGNLDANPYFVNQPNFNNAPTTAGDLRLTTCSFAMDAGLDAANSTTEDLDGNARKFDALAGGQQIDMGAYELQSQPPTISITCPSNFIGGQCGATSVTYPTPTASGNCDAPSLLSGIASGGTFPVGETTVVWKATNNSGQNNTCSFKVTVVSGNDTQAPSITCPANQTRSTDAGQCQASVTYATPVATDNCALAAGSPSLQSGIASGGFFPKGQTTVVWRATDQAGLTKTCTFRVTVNDTQAPTFTLCPSSQTLNTEPNLCSAVANYTTPTAADNCAPPPTVLKTSGLASGSAFPKGTSTVVWKATDGAGLTKTCSFTVMVTDAQPPAITCPGNIAVTGSGSPCTETVNYASPTATDNCEVQSVFLLSGLASGSMFPAGTTNVVWRAIDNSGGSQNCAFTVTVNCGSASEQGGVSREQFEVLTTDSRQLITMHLAPNPATTQVQITVENLGENGGVLSVFDAMGRTVWQQRIGSETLTSATSEQTRISLDDHWKAGVYMVVLHTDGQTVTKRLVVSRL